MSASTRWSCVTLNQTTSESIAWEKAVRCVIWSLCPWLSLWAQSLPVLHYRYGCASLFSLLILWLLSDLNLRLGLRPVSPLQLLLHNLVLCHLTSSGISESWSIMDLRMVQLLSSTQSILHSESSRAALTYSKSLSSQHTLPPHLHHASKTLTVGNFLSCFLCWNEQMESHDQSRWTCDRGV